MRGGSASIVVLTLLLLAGCGGPPALGPPVALDPAKGRRSIGIVSSIGGKFAVKKVGITAFGNELNHFPIPSWAIDDLVASKLAALLGNTAEVKRIAYNKDAFATYEAPGGLLRDRDAEFRDGLRKITAGQGCDLYLAVIASTSPFGSTNQVVTGLGIVQTGNMFTTNAWAYAVFQIRAYDGRSLQPLGWKPATIGQSTFMAAIKGPHREVDTSWWPEAGSPEADGRLRAVTRELVEEALTATLPEILDLAPSRPIGQL
jgi:hypothetical protein